MTVLAVLRADGVIAWPWYWLLAPAAVGFVLVVFAAVVAAISKEID